MGSDNGMEKMYQTFTPDRVGRFLAALRKGYSVAHACRLLRVSRVTVYKYRRENEAFRLEWEDAVQEGTDLLEDEVRRRALVGVKEPVFQKGIEVGQVTRYSDALLIFLLKGRRPEKFRDNVDLTSGGEKIKAPMVFLPQVVSEEFEADAYSPGQYSPGQWDDEPDAYTEDQRYEDLVRD